MPQVSFATNNRQFHIELNDRVKQYFKENNMSQRGNFSLYFKAFFMFAVVLSIYYVLVFVQPESLLLTFTLLAIFGTFSAFIGFNVMHDPRCFFQ
jgi:linoleoyl-CoA desaturase